MANQEYCTRRERERERPLFATGTTLSVSIAAPALSSVPLSGIDDSLHPIYTNGCCGIGHRLSRVIPTIVYANRHGRKARVFWGDVPLSALFNDTDYVESVQRDKGWAIAKKQDLLITNSHPRDWSGQSTKQYNKTGTVLDRYSNKEFFSSPLIISVLASMRDSLSPLVLSYLSPIRAQLNRATKYDHHVTICTHVRQGNNETGDWANKKWRHVDLQTLLNSTYIEMEKFVLSRNASMVSIYVASDSDEARPWFDANVPKNWNVIQPKKVMPKPDNGVWFGQAGSKTAAILNQTMKNEAMAEATADVFALGECDALMIPNYSSFSYSGIALTRARGNPVFFKQENDMPTFQEMSTFAIFGNE